MSTSLLRPLAVLLLTSTLAIVAAEPEPIPADHRWVVALDVATVMKGKLGETIRTAVKQPLPAAGLAAVAAATGCDLLADIDRVILTGVDAREDEALFLAEGRFDGSRIEAAIASAAEHGATTYGTHTIHHWLDQKKHVTQFGAVARDRVVLVGRSEARLRSALDVLDGSSSGLGQPAWLGGPSESGALLVVAAADGLDSWQGLQPNAQSFKRLRSLRVVAAERGDAIALHVSGMAVDAKAGQQIGDLVRGLLALGQMGDAKQQPALAELLASAQVQQNGSAIELTAALPIAEIADALARQGFAGGNASAAAPGPGK